MRKLRKSENYSDRQWRGLLCLSNSNTSTKQHARLLHSLADVAANKPPGLPRKFVFVPTNKVNRAMRRAFAFGNVQDTENMEASVPASMQVRKLTGAVRRGLQRGKVA